MKDEIWTMKDGTKIAVGDMTEDHVRNALRMVIRVDRKRRNKLRQLEMLKRVMEMGTAGHHESDFDLEMTVGDIQDMLSSQAYNQLSNPNAFFPLLEGGRHGSPDLAARYDPRKRG